MDVAILILIAIASFGLILYITRSGGTEESRFFFNRTLCVLFLLISLLLLPGIVGSFLRGLRENAPRKQEPADCGMDPSPGKHRFFWQGSPESLIPLCVDFIEKNFSRHYTFHSFHAPHLFHYYLAKKGSWSLYTPAWIKTGFLIFFLALCAHLFNGDFLSHSQGRLLILVLAVCFWIPGILVLILAPYQKFWLSLVSREGSVQVNATCVSPFRRAGKEALCSSLEPFVYGSRPAPSRASEAPPSTPSA